MSEIKRVSVLTHTRPQETAELLHVLRELAADSGVELHFDADETAKHGLSSGEGIVVNSDAAVDLCIVMGGDGTILYALRRYADTEVPVFAVNFGEVGFLATVERERAREGFSHAFAGEFELLALPAICLEHNGEKLMAINEVSVHRSSEARIAHLAYEIADEEIARVRCDGVVVATPAGSTGYNLANHGPVLAWGVEGCVVSFIAPHALSARSLVVAPHDPITIRNVSSIDTVEISIDGRLRAKLEPESAIELSFSANRALLAQLSGTTFYRRLHDRFGRLSS